MSEDQIKDAFSKIKEDILTIKEAINILSDEIEEIKRTLDQTQTKTQQTDRQVIQTVQQEIGGSKPPISSTSIGNEGVQTDRQTIRQTDRHTEKFALIKKEQDPITQIEKVSEVLKSLDTIKKELRIQFKKLTQQEMLVFSTLYQLEEQGFKPDYTLIANKTNLSESSIRDYIQKIIKKGVPVEKIKENNKKITLSIPQNLRRMASLDTILALREI